MRYDVIIYSSLAGLVICAGLAILATIEQVRLRRRR
jgi:hypothetical protein